ncbi:heavy metal-responsive transcriptional regulator [Psychromonas sp. psych-6C06]|uniref:MerR family DNA-binding protein n=1 Tax=Psychromonas sp. psych-6C06 TaxID=2058089 RepID=UPI000C333D43|nr:MerR family DNA-binding protein [Psychromonas sp. psych-6C06]PKF63648.1 heavy metal-responsive transcriptional regulator [Psychromonas sp. psych-6C06]
MLSISQAAKATGLSIKSIRHYEEIGLISTPPRSDNEYRYYPESIMKQLHFIKSTKAAGFNLKESRALLSLSEDNQRSSHDVKQIALQKIAELETRIKQQQTLLRSLKQLTHQCSGDKKSECPIINAFSGG